MRATPRLLVAATLAATLAALAGCTAPRAGFQCTDDTSCRSGGDGMGTCQPTGACSFPDATCASGQRYGAASDPLLANVCVGDEPVSDAGPGGDATPDGPPPPPAQDMLGTFSLTDAPPVSSHTQGAVVLDGRIYVSGGIVGSTMRDQVYIGTPNLSALTPALTLQDGWRATTPLPAQRRNHGMTAVGNHLFVIGGRAAPGGGTTGSVISAPVDPGTGDVGAWTETTPLNPALKCAPAVSTASHVYVIGGKDASGVVDRVIMAPVTGGELGQWALAGNLPAPVACPAALIHAGFLWVIGGCRDAPAGGGCTPSAAVYAARIEADGSLSALTNLTAMPAGRWHHAAFVANGFLYVLGGETDGNVATPITDTSVWAAPIQADFTLGSWGVSRPLLQPRWRPSAHVVGDYVYLVAPSVQVAKVR